jgi:homogentisate 1,2-dioxygenase
MAARAFFEPIKTLAFGGISGAYASVGSPSDHEIRVFKISNNTQGDMYFTTDVNEDQIFLSAGAFTLYDVQANIGPPDDKFVLPKGTQFSVKQITAPTSGDVYIEIIY